MDGIRLFDESEDANETDDLILEDEDPFYGFESESAEIDDDPFLDDAEEEYFGDPFDGDAGESRTMVGRNAWLRRRRSARKRKLRKARLAAARRAMLQRKRRINWTGRTSPRGSTKQVRRAIRKVHATAQRKDIENKVNSDILAGAARKQSDRITGTEYALTASKVVDELKGTLPADIASNQVVKALLPLGPLLFLKPSMKGDGFEKLARDPRVWGTALAGGLALYSGFLSQSKEVTEVRIQPSGTVVELNAKDVVPFQAQAVDRNGQTVAGANLQWQSSDAAIATVDPSTGVVTAVKTGIAVIMATETESQTKSVTNGLVRVS